MLKEEEEDLVCGGQGRSVRQEEQEGQRRVVKAGEGETILACHLAPAL